MLVLTHKSCAAIGTLEMVTLNIDINKYLLGAEESEVSDHDYWMDSYSDFLRFAIKASWEVPSLVDCCEYAW